MIELNEQVTVTIEISTLAVLISGLYCMESVVDPVAIPVSVYIELVEKLKPFLETWDFSQYSFEDWVKYNLIIAPLALFQENDIEEFKTNEIYFERENGNATLLVTAKMV